MEIKKFGWASMICAAIVMGSGLTSCSDDDNTGNGNTEEPKVIYDERQPSAKVFYSTKVQNWVVATKNLYLPVT